METLTHSTTHIYTHCTQACTNFPVQSGELDQHYGQLESLIIQRLPHKMPWCAAKTIQHNLSTPGCLCHFMKEVDFSFTRLFWHIILTMRGPVRPWKHYDTWAQVRSWWWWRWWSFMQMAQGCNHIPRTEKNRCKKELKIETTLFKSIPIPIIRSS